MSFIKRADQEDKGDFKMKSKYDYCTNFVNRHRVKTIDGIYRHKESGKLLKLRNMYYQGMIDGETNKPFDTYEGEITMKGGPSIKKCSIDFHEFSEYELIFTLGTQRGFLKEQS